MRRIALLLVTAMLTLVGTSTAASALTDPYGAVLDEVTLECLVTADSSLTASGLVECTGGGLDPNTAYEIIIQWQALNANASAASFNVTARAVGFVGAQGSLTTQISGTTNPNGNFSTSGVIPAGADSNAPSVATLAGTSNGAPTVAADTLNAQATPPVVGGEETPATGAESGTLALIAAGALVLGAGALVATRRRKTELVA